MTKRALLVCSLMAMAMSLSAQDKNGGISSEILQRIQQKSKVTSVSKAIQNALAYNSIDDVARNAANKGELNTFFSDETAKQNIQDQKSSGRCWMFTGLNVLRSDFTRNSENKLSVEFSHDYLYFWDQLEKANLMLQGVIDCAKKPMDDPEVRFFFKSPLNDGGTFSGVIDVAGKYGVVPKEVQPETFSSENTNRIARIIKSKLREFGLELRTMAASKKKTVEIQTRKVEMLAEIYRMLALALGEPVKSFEYTFTDKNGKATSETKTYTPKEFYDKTVGHSLKDTYIMIMNDPRHEYYKTYEVQYDRHVYDGHNWRFLNLPMEEVSKLAIASIKAGHKMYSSYDVGKQLDRTRGYLATDNYDYESLFSTSFNMNKAERIMTFDSGSTHAMTLTAVNLDKSGKPMKWKVENSWGQKSGANGYLIMTNDWFNEYFFRLVVERKFIPENLIKLYEQKPILLPYDDPVFGLDD